jgi:flagellar assembly protein FliH
MALAVCNVIKGGVGIPRIDSFCSFELADHLEEAGRIRARATVEADELLRSAGEDARRIRRDAYELGYKEGRTAGKEKGIEEGNIKGKSEAFEFAKKVHAEDIQNLIDALQTAATVLDDRKESVLLTAEKNVLECVLTLVGKISTRIGSFDHDVVVENIKRAVRHIGSTTDLSLHIHPADLALAQQLTGGRRDSILSAEHVAIQTDESITRGGAILKTRDTIVDATIDTQLDAICDLLLSSYKNGEA